MMSFLGENQGNGKCDVHQKFDGGKRLGPTSQMRTWICFLDFLWGSVLKFKQTLLWEKGYKTMDLLECDVSWDDLVGAMFHGI